MEYAAAELGLWWAAQIEGTSFMGRFEESIKLLGALKKKGVAAGVYTQTTDVRR